jgi:hypothetical protein
MCHEANSYKENGKEGNWITWVIGKVMLLIISLIGFTCESWDTQLEREW